MWDSTFLNSNYGNPVGMGLNRKICGDWGWNRNVIASMEWEGIETLAEYECSHRLQQLCNVHSTGFFKKVAPKTFWNTFTSVKSFCVKFCMFVGKPYPHVSTNFFLNSS